MGLFVCGVVFVILLLAVVCEIVCEFIGEACRLDDD
jgi:hypothetical protein